MWKFFTALALVSLIAIPTLTQTANAAPVSPASSSFGGNGYRQIPEQTSTSARGSTHRTAGLRS